jgi:regulator of protease activity HflC (stomatin/prohibitin superfamily)
MAEQPNSTEEAMNRVLEAERAAHAAVAECEAQAAALLEAAQQQARRIHTRADNRLSQIHAHCALALGQQVEQLLQQDTGTTATPNLGDEMHELLAAAVTRLAESLTGGVGNDE